MFDTIVANLDRAVLEMVFVDGFHDFFYLEGDDGFNKIKSYINLISEDKNTEEDDNSIIDITFPYLNESVIKYGEMLLAESMQQKGFKDPANSDTEGISGADVTSLPKEAKENILTKSGLKLPKKAITEGMKQGGPDDPANSKTEGITGADATSTLSTEVRKDILDDAGLKVPAKASTKKITEGIDRDFILFTMMEAFQKVESLTFNNLTNSIISGVVVGKVLNEALFSNEGIRQDAGVLERAGKFYTGYRSQLDATRQAEAAKAEISNKFSSKLRKLKDENEQLKATKLIKPTETSESNVVQNVAKKSTEDLSGTEAAGHAIKKGLTSAGESTGNIGEKIVKIAGEHPVAAAGAAGLGAAYLLGKRKKAQQ